MAVQKSIEWEGALESLPPPTGAGDALAPHPMLRARNGGSLLRGMDAGRVPDVMPRSGRLCVRARHIACCSRSGRVVPLMAIAQPKDESLSSVVTACAIAQSRGRCGQG